MRLLVVVDGTMGAGAARRQAAALAAFLRDGLAGRDPDVTADPGDTLVFYDADGDRQALIDLAPTRSVRPAKVAAGRRELQVDILAGVTRDERPELVLFAGGAAGTELATRLARRAGGSVLTGALGIEIGGERLRVRRAVYSGHLIGRFELTRRPWCVAVDASWSGEHGEAPLEHEVLAGTAAAAPAARGAESGRAVPLEDVELVALSAPSDLAASRFVVAAGLGAGGRDGVERLAAAARRNGARHAVTRPVAMNAWAPMDRLVGVSGTRTAPDLCLVAGASGAPAFLWGVEKAGFIVAVNVDGGAPIADAADVVLLDDAVAVVEELARIVEAEGGGEEAAEPGASPGPAGHAS